MNKKDQAQLSLEELMEIAKLPLLPDTTKDLPPVRRFIVSDGLEVGDEKIPAMLIYDRYTIWAKLNNVEPLVLQNFFKEFKLYFNKIQNGTGNYYILSPKGFDLSPQRLASVKAANPMKRNSSGKKTTNKKT